MDSDIVWCRSGYKALLKSIQEGSNRMDSLLIYKYKVVGNGHIVDDYAKELRLLSILKRTLIFHYNNYNNLIFHYNLSKKYERNLGKDKKVFKKAESGGGEIRLVLSKCLSKYGEFSFLFREEFKKVNYIAY